MFKKAEITITLSITLTIVLSLIFTLIEGARNNAMRMEIECVINMGLESVFAEYNRELLNRYDLFFIDSSYGEALPDMDRIAARLNMYISKNLSQEGGIFDSTADFFKMSVDAVWLEEKYLASDGNGTIFKRQAIDYMKDKIGLSYAELIMEQIKTVKDNGYETTDIEGEQNLAKAQIDNAVSRENIRRGEEADTNSGGAAWQEAKIDNPAKEVSDSRRGFGLSTVLKSGDIISSAAVALQNYISVREKAEGDGEIPKEWKDFSLLDEVLFGEYIMEVCGNYTKEIDNNLLKYQAEYVLFGKSNDRDNLEAMVLRLLLIREGANAAYIFSNAEKTAEADLMAAGIAAAAGVPMAQPALKISILLAWAFAESALDVNILLNGGKVPLIKDMVTWRLGLMDSLHYKDFFGKVYNSGGLDYNMYLRLLLGLTSTEKKTQRMMDIIEMDMRKTKGNASFRLDGCVDRFIAVAEIKSGYGKNYIIKRAYSYI